MTPKIGGRNIYTAGTYMPYDKYRSNVTLKEGLPAVACHMWPLFRAPCELGGEPRSAAFQIVMRTLGRFAQPFRSLFVQLSQPHVGAMPPKVGPSGHLFGAYVNHLAT